MRKKWFIVILFLVIIAVVMAIIFINLFKERDTKRLSTNINNVLNGGYLDSNGEIYTTIEEYLNNILPMLKAEDQAQDKETNQDIVIENYQEMYDSYIVFAQFVNREFVFSQYNETYQVQSNKIIKNLSNAQNSAENMVNYINENKDLVADSSFWTVNTWATCKVYMDELINNTYNAYVGLVDVFQASVPSKFVNNELTSLIFSTAQALQEDILETPTILLGETLKTLINAYLTKDNEWKILEYLYDETAQQNVQTILNDQDDEKNTVYNNFLVGEI